MECRQSGSHSHRVRAQRSGLVNRARGRNQLHQILSPAVTGYRKTAADHLAIRNQIGSHPKDLSHAAQRNAKAGNHFVKDHQTAVLTRNPDCLFNELAPLD